MVKHINQIVTGLCKAVKRFTKMTIYNFSDAFFVPYRHGFFKRVANFVFWNFKIVRHIRCFVLGHYIVHNRGWYENAYCEHCGQDHDKIDEQMTTPMYLNSVYGWFVEREWKWFDSLDLWLIDKFGNRLPKWWEY